LRSSTTAYRRLVSEQRGQLRVAVAEAQAVGLVVDGEHAHRSLARLERDAQERLGVTQNQALVVAAGVVLRIVAALGLAGAQRLARERALKRNARAAQQLS
jgi:hypothetical protein